MPIFSCFKNYVSVAGCTALSLLHFKMSVWLKCGCLYLFHVFIVMSLRGVANGQNYQILKGYNFQANSRLWEDEAVRSLTQCVVVCKQTERCCCVVLTSSTGKCSYHDWFKNDSSYLAVVDGDADDIMILVKSIPSKNHFLHVLYKITT